MAGQEVLLRTQQLTEYLTELGKASNLTAEQLQQLERVAEQIKGINVETLQQSTRAILDFREQLRGVGIDSVGIYNATQYYMQLTRALELYNIQAEKMSRLGILGRAQEEVNKILYPTGKGAQAGPAAGLTQEEEDRLFFAQKRRDLASIGIQSSNTTAERRTEAVKRVYQNLTDVVENRERFEEMITRELEQQRIIQEQIRRAESQGFEREFRQQQEDIRRYEQNTLTGKWGGTANAWRRAGATAGGTQHDLDSQKEEDGNLSKTQGVISSEALQRLNISAVAAQTLTKKLSDMGVTAARVTRNVTELSSGIQTVTFTATDEATGAVKTFTAHIDRMGNVLQDTQKRFRSFGSAVMRDVVEVLKWTIAISAIYGPIRKLGEMLQQMKDIQLALVDVEIVLGDSTNKLQIAFESAAKVATETSSSILGVIQGYSLAASAAAGAGNEFERLVATESLLKNSMILSKLAGLDQKQSLDTLVGAISQAGLSLTEGTKLLDSWVAVSKKSNVSVNQLATTFSIVGSAAQEIGLTFDELNALVGAMAQATNLSADEIGNAIRGIIAAMQTDKASAEFAKYGIATKTLENDMRDLMEVLRELKVMQEAGILDEKAMGALMQAGGAGARRGAQLSALVQNLSTVMDLITVSEQASGDAEKAMALEMSTLDAATTRLNNAFAELAQTLGGEGGILDFLTAVTKAATVLVGGIKDLVSVMKWAAPVFATFLLAKGIAGTATGINILSTAIPKALQLMLTSPTFAGVDMAGKSLAGKDTNNAILKWLQSRNLGVQTQTVAGGAFSGYAPATIGSWMSGIGSFLKRPLFPQQNLYQSTAYAQAMQRNQNLGMTGLVSGGFAIPNIFKNMNWGSIIGPAIVASTNIGRENGGERAAWAVGGGILGAMTGNPLLATIGSIIATGFYDEFLTFEGDIAQKWLTYITENPQTPITEGTPQTWADVMVQSVKELLTGNPPSYVPPEEEKEPTLDEILADLDKNLVESLSWLERANVNVLQKQPGWMYPKGFQGEDFRSLLENEALTLLAVYSAQKQGKYITGETIGEPGITPILSDETMRRIDEYLNMYALKSVEEGITATSVEQAKISEIQEISNLASVASADLMKRALEDIASGAAGAIETFSSAQQVAGQLATSAGTLIEAQQRTPGMAPISQPAAVRLVSLLTPEEATKLLTAATDITSGLSQLEVIEGQIAEAQARGVAITDIQIEKRNALNEQIQTAIRLYPQLYAAMQQRAFARELESQIRPTVEVPEGLTEDQLRTAAENADKAWMEWLKINTQASQDEIDAYVATVEAQLLEANGKITGITMKAPQKFLQLEFEDMGIGEQIGLEDWRDTMGKANFSALMAAYTQAIPLLQKMFPGWQPSEENVGFLLSDGFDMQHVDMSILNMLMRDLIDVEKEKGLQGMYNLPAGATFYVPVTAYELHKQTQAELAGGGGLGGMQSLIDALNQWALALREPAKEIDVFQGQNLNEIEPGKGFTFGGQEYKMFGPSVPEGGLPYTQGNPLPVMITNWFEEAQANATPGTFTPVPNIFEQAQQNAEPNTFTPVVPQTTVPNQVEEKQLNFLQKLLEWLSNVGLLQNLPELQSNGMTTGQAPLTTALNLAVDSTITLTVDGRTLATIIKPYLYQDLIRFNTATTSSISKSVIA